MRGDAIHRQDNDRTTLASTQEVPRLKNDKNPAEKLTAARWQLTGGHARHRRSRTGARPVGRSVGGKHGKTDASAARRGWRRAPRGAGLLTEAVGRNAAVCAARAPRTSSQRRFHSLPDVVAAGAGLPAHACGPRSALRAQAAVHKQGG